MLLIICLTLYLIASVTMVYLITNAPLVDENERPIQHSDQPDKGKL